MNKKFIIAMVCVLIASILPDIILIRLTGEVPNWLNYIKVIILISASLLCIINKQLRQLITFSPILTTIILTQIMTGYISSTVIWKSYFKADTFISRFSGSILLKLFSIIPIVVVLLIMFRSTKQFFMSKGDLSMKADKIGWLGIREGSISWGKLSVISAILITVGTFFFTFITVIGMTTPKGIDVLIKYFPVIICFALVNSFCEGVIYRSAILGTLRTALPKNQVIIIAAMFFGIAHYYGAPGGIIGIFAAGILGWYMCRSMYETNGFLSSWIIHFMQDIVIISSVCLFGVSV